MPNIDLTNDIYVNYNGSRGPITDQTTTPVTATTTDTKPADVSITLDAVQQRQATALLRSEGIATNFQELYGGSGSDIDDLNINVFNRYKTIFPGDELSSAIVYVFMVKPDLNILHAMNVDPYFENLWMTNPNIMRCLTHTESEQIFPEGAPQTHFIPFLFDRVIMYQLPDVELRTYTLDQPFTTFKTTYAGNANESRSGQSFSIEFRESANMSVIRFFEAWVRYMDLVAYGTAAPFTEYLHSRMGRGVNEIDYATSIYMLMTKPDGMELMYWHKMTGAIPTGIPHSNFSYNSGGSIDNTVTISFTGGMPEVNDPRILIDFNYNAGMYGEDEYGRPHGVKVTNARPVPHARIGFENLRGGSPLVGGPYIAFNKARKKFLLKWRDIQ